MKHEERICTYVGEQSAEACPPQPVKRMQASSKTLSQFRSFKEDPGLWCVRSLSEAPASRTLLPQLAQGKKTLN